ncbi:MAG: MarC family protein [Limisphaerales bacterium]
MRSIDAFRTGKTNRNYAFALLLGSMLLGSFVLRLFGLSIPIVQVAGGAVVCSLGWNLLTDSSSKPANVVADVNRARMMALGRAFYPLTLPLTIDAGVISVAITVGANHAHTIEHALIQLLAAIIGAAIVALAVLLTYHYAAAFGKRIGSTGMTVTLRLSAFITLCIGVSICWNGIKSLLMESAFVRCDFAVKG